MLNLVEQLQKMGILPSTPKAQEKTPASQGRRRSMQADFANLKPLNPRGLMGFSKFRDPNEDPDANGTSTGKAGKRRQNDIDSDDDEELDGRKEVLIKTEGDDIQDVNGKLSPEDAKRQAELAQGVQKIRVGRMFKQ